MGLRTWPLHSINQWLSSAPHQSRIFYHHIDFEENTMWNISLKNFQQLVHLSSPIQSSILALLYSSSLVAPYMSIWKQNFIQPRNYALDSRIPTLYIPWTLLNSNSFETQLALDERPLMEVAGDGNRLKGGSYLAMTPPSSCV